MTRIYLDSYDKFVKFGAFDTELQHLIYADKEPGFS